MIDLQIDPTRTSPLVILNSAENKIEIRGKSSPESAIHFYYPLIEKVKSLFRNCTGDLNVHIGLEYFNTSSSKCLFDLLKALKQTTNTAGNGLVVHWYYEDADEDMLESGEDFEDILDLDFNYVVTDTPLDRL